RLQHDQASQYRDDYSDRNQGKLEVVYISFTSLQKVRQEENQRELGKLGRLYRESGELDPTMRIRRGRQKKDDNQQSNDDRERGKHDCRMFVCVIVHFHHDKHDSQTKRRKNQLLE